MTASVNLHLVREQARRYSRISFDSNNWVPGVRDLVQHAGDEDWGTFIASRAVLESVIPQAEVIVVNQQIEYEQKESEYRQRAEKRRSLIRIACLLCGFAIAMMFVSTVPYFAAFEAVKATLEEAVFCEMGLVVFSLIGGSSAGCIAGNQIMRSADEGGIVVALAMAGVAGLCGSFVCFFLPPACLVLVWFAWQTSTEDSIGTLGELETQVNNRLIHGRRVYARDPHAPSYVKRAIRFAGAKQNETGYVGLLAHEALSRNQDDYGAFIVYDALFEDWRVTSAADSSDSVEDPDEGNEGEDASDGETGTEESHVRNRRGVLAGVSSALLVCLLANYNEIFAFVSPVGFYDASGYMKLMVLVGVGAVGALIGLRCSHRARVTYGLSDSQKRRECVFRSALFAAWVAMIVILGLFLMMQI